MKCFTATRLFQTLGIGPYAELGLIVRKAAETVEQSWGMASTESMRVKCMRRMARTRPARRSAEFHQPGRPSPAVQPRGVGRLRRRVGGGGRAGWGRPLRCGGSAAELTR